MNPFYDFHYVLSGLYEFFVATIPRLGRFCFRILLSCFLVVNISYFALWGGWDGALGIRAAGKLPLQAEKGVSCWWLLLGAGWERSAGSMPKMHVEVWKKRDEARIGRQRRVSSGRMWPATAPLRLT
jgi:hypothetical protein